jgi:hypothetical protein
MNNMPIYYYIIIYILENESTYCTSNRYARSGQDGYDSQSLKLNKFYRLAQQLVET